MKWVKASERLPPPYADNNLKIDNMPFSGRYIPADYSDQIQRPPFQHFNVAGKTILDSKSFARVYWLDETEEQTTTDVEQAAEKYAYSQVPNPKHYASEYYTSGDKWDDAKDSFIAGAKWNQGKEAKPIPVKGDEKSAEDLYEKAYLQWESTNLSLKDCIVEVMEEYASQFKNK